MEGGGTDDSVNCLDPVPIHSVIGTSEDIQVIQPARIGSGRVFLYPFAPDPAPVPIILSQPHSKPTHPAFSPGIP